MKSEEYKRGYNAAMREIATSKQTSNYPSWCKCGSCVGMGGPCSRVKPAGLGRS